MLGLWSWRPWLIGLGDFCEQKFDLPMAGCWDNGNLEPIIQARYEGRVRLVFSGRCQRRTPAPAREGLFRYLDYGPEHTIVVARDHLKGFLDALQRQQVGGQGLDIHEPALHEADGAGIGVFHAPNDFDG